MSETLPVIGATITLIFGLLSLVMPLQVSRTLGIDPEGPLGLSEVRANYGGFFIGIGIACLIFRTPELFAAVGIAWIAAALIRLGSIRFDESRSGTNMTGLAVEAVTGLLFLAGVL